METKQRPWELLGFALLLIVLAISYKWAEREKTNQIVSIESNESANLGTDGDVIKVKLTPKPGQVLTVSGWRVGVSTNIFTLPNASYLPDQGKINEEKPIVISSPTILLISSKRSPIGVSFRENKCIGMLGTFQNFEPALPGKCADCNEESAGYPDYNACVANHMRESDFFSDTWRIYLANTQNWISNDRVIRLYNENGKLLDTRTQ